MRVLITGGGMVGSHAARELVTRGDDVTILDAAPREAYIREIAGPAVGIIQGDITELPGLVEAARDVRPDVLLHTAALIGGEAQRVPYRGIRVNVDGTVNVAEAVRLLEIRRIVYASTLGVYDLSQPQPAPIDETFPLGSSGRIYGASKVACEALLDAYANAYGFELAMLRFAGIYGRGHFGGGSGIGPEIHGLVSAAMAGRPVVLGAGIPPSYEVVHVKDVARGVAAAVHADPLRHRAYNLGTGVLVTPEDVAAAARRAFPGADVGVGASRPDAHPRLQPLDLSRSRMDLGYEPLLGLERGLLDLASELAGTATTA
jgi:nucleoside-diphosphate-sugar epimerase